MKESALVSRNSVHSARSELAEGDDDSKTSKSDDRIKILRFSMQRVTTLIR
jgi:hypothetical protein